MGWTTRGKVNVTLNSAVVTGVGSLFLQDGRIGDGFRGPDGRIYEVTNIATNTGLTIQPPYEGPTVNDATYYLAPFEGYVKDTADALRAASLQIGQFPLTKQDKNANLDALSGLTGAADRMPYFTGAGALSLATLTAKARLFNARTDAAGMRAEITAASSGANSDITRLSGLTTALSVGQGGTGGTDAASARAGLGLGTTGNYDVLPVTKGGTGGINQSEGRAGLGLGSAATANTGTDPGNVMPVGAFGLGNRVNPGASSMNRWTTGFSVISDGTQHRPVSYGTLIDVGYPGGSLGSQLWMGVAPGGLIGFRSGDYAYAEFNIIYHTGNTTRAADGTLKAI